MLTLPFPVRDANPSAGGGDLGKGSVSMNFYPFDIYEAELGPTDPRSNRWMKRFD